MKQLEKLLNKTEYASKILFYIGCISLVVMFLLIFFDVAFRFAFNAPITGTDVFAAYLMVAVGFLALGYGYFTGAHVRMEFFGNTLFKNQRKYLEIIVLLIVIGFFIVMTWQIGARAYADWAAKVLISNSNTPLPVWWQSFIAAVGSAMLVLSLIVELIRKILKFIVVSEKVTIVNSEKQGA